MRESFGEWLKGRRDAFGWKQEELARRADINQSTISRLERDITSLAGADAKTVSGIAAALGLPIADVLSAADVGIVAGLDPEIIEAAYRLQRLSLGHREAALTFIEQLAAQESTDHEIGR